MEIIYGIYLPDKCMELAEKNVKQEREKVILIIGAGILLSKGNNGIL